MIFRFIGQLLLIFVSSAAILFAALINVILLALAFEYTEPTKSDAIRNTEVKGGK